MSSSNQTCQFKKKVLFVIKLKRYDDLLMWHVSFVLVKSVPYMTILKPGSNTCRGSNIRRVQLGDCHNKRRGSFKRRGANDMY